jgi:beta-fructofuranosidase
VNSSQVILPTGGFRLRIKPLSELETLRHKPVMLGDIKISKLTIEVLRRGAPVGETIATLGGDAVEVRITIAREQAARKLFGFTLFSDGKGGGLPIVFRPETGTLRVGTAEAPFSVADLPAGEDVQLRIYIDKYVVEVFAGDRQAMIAIHADHFGKRDLAPTTLKKVEIWKLKPTNQGFLAAQNNRIWEPNTK